MDGEEDEECMGEGGGSRDVEHEGILGVKVDVRKRPYMLATQHLKHINIWQQHKCIFESLGRYLLKCDRTLMALTCSVLLQTFGQTRLMLSKPERQCEY